MTEDEDLIDDDDCCKVDANDFQDAAFDEGVENCEEAASPAEIIGLVEDERSLYGKFHGCMSDRSCIPGSFFLTQ